METKEHEHDASEEHNHHASEKKLSPFGHFFRLLASWFGFTSLYATFSVCPFCGQQGCPVGIVSASTVGAFFALCLQDWKTLISFIKGKISKKVSK